MQERRKHKPDRRQENRSIEKNFKFLQSVINGVSDPILVIGSDMQVKLINQAARNFPALKNETDTDIADSHCYRLLFGLDKPCSQTGRHCPLIDVLETGRAVTAEHQIELTTGEANYFEILASPLLGDDGTPLGIIEVLRDVTLRHHATEALQKSHEELELRIRERTSDILSFNEALQEEIVERRKAEEDLSQAIEQATLIYRVIPSAIFTVDTQQRITSWNNKAEKLTGYSRKDVLGKPCNIFSMHPCRDRCGVFSPDAKTPIINKECIIKTKDGRLRVISKNADRLHDSEGNITGAVESFEDITDKKEFENQLRTERDKFHAMLSALDQGLHILTRDYEIVFQNENLRKTFGDKIGDKCHKVYKNREEPCDDCKMREALDSDEIRRGELILDDGRWYEQSYVPFEDVDNETKVLILLRDITDEKARQAETLRAGQLASIGELAASVAHEINNPINGIINYAQILLDDIQDEVGSDVLGRIIKEGERIADIVSNLLAFSRQEDSDSNLEVDVEKVIGDSFALIKHQLQKDGISVTMEIPDDLPCLRLNHQKLQQVILNLLSNARYALNRRYPNRDPNKIILVTCTTVTLRGDLFLRTEVTDHGIGIPEEIIGNIFDPFFSTKGPGEGTGLGLSITHGLIKDFNGFLGVSSKEGEYTTMTVDLPACKEEGEANA
ncbi:MAG: PAS domain-containing protein [Desulfobulbaceae bacterium]|nr:PAS domain-containing protein [Desulfobulbaceae bacterium]